MFTKETGNDSLKLPVRNLILQLGPSCQPLNKQCLWQILPDPGTLGMRMSAAVDLLSLISVHGMRGANAADDVAYLLLVPGADGPSFKSC